MPDANVHPGQAEIQEILGQPQDYIRVAGPEFSDRGDGVEHLLGRYHLRYGTPVPNARDEQASWMIQKPAPALPRIGHALPHTQWNLYIQNLIANHE